MSKPKLNQSKNIVISTQCFPPAIGGIENLMKDLANNLHKKKKSPEKKKQVLAESRFPHDLSQ